jgi:hypothetical protein
VDAAVRALGVVVVGLVVLVVARLLAGVGLLDDALAAAIQLLLIPVKLVGVLLAAVRSLATGDPAPSPTAGGGLDVPVLTVVGPLVLAGLFVFRRPILAALGRRRRSRRLRVPAPPVPTPAPVPVAVPAPPPVAPEGVARVAGWEREVPAATVRYLEWLREGTQYGHRVWTR